MVTLPCSYKANNYLVKETQKYSKKLYYSGKNGQSTLSTQTGRTVWTYSIKYYYKVNIKWQL